MNTEEKLHHALHLLMDHKVGRYLMSNAEGRWSGAEKALRHEELCTIFVAVEYCIELDDVRGHDEYEEKYKAVHTGTQTLTDNLDKEIGFPLTGIPDYDHLEPLFFERFLELAYEAIK